MDLHEKARIFSALSDPVRLRIVELLDGREQACGKELSEALGASVALVSHHAKLLEEAGLIVRKKEGQYSRFSLNRDAFERIGREIPLRPSAGG